MSNTRKTIFLLVLLVLLSVLEPPAGRAQAAAATPQVLLLFDSEAKGTPQEGNIMELQRLLAAYSIKVTVVSLDQYEPGGMAAYSHRITVINAPDIAVTNRSYLEDAGNYKGQELHVGYNPPDRLKQALKLSTDIMHGGSVGLFAGRLSGASLSVQEMPYITAAEGKKDYGRLVFQGVGLQAPYAVSAGRYTYVPYLEQGNVSVLAMAGVLREWLGSTAVPQTYFVLKEIYPFSDLALLEETAERLYEAGIPFIASVRPVFSNTDYPAMLRYLEALKVVQSRNGSILVNAPVVMPSISGSDDTLGAKMSGFVDLLVKNGIAPLGMGAEIYWTYDKEYAAAGMGWFDSAVLFPDERLMHRERTNRSTAFESSLYSLPLEFLQNLHTSGKVMPAFPLDTAVTANLPEDEAGLTELLERLDGYWISFADYKQEEHRVVTDTNKVVSSRGNITLNGQHLNVDYSARNQVSDDYQYTEEQQKSFTKLFNVQNQFFIVVIIICLLFFGGLLIIGYRMYRKKYLK
ncbi:hypothetical protein J7E73_13710 [Paenibacillus albidus]|uniref:hypothetical protein n=1 Tax=Paenibacillus albidus TaxID=2041023 RepID=UPI001BEB86B7|nr:hypothetical protein [Paenibacillus albidus]MBT2290180.1 hypothetical protein [Paenibacillus albidus]